MNPQPAFPIPNGGDKKFNGRLVGLIYLDKRFGETLRRDNRRRVEFGPRRAKSWVLR
jgi:hypothetical protein